jgi:1-acyl-sn-glycerol-3-phosphate acyltransferase
VLALFPEGERSPDGAPRRFKKGAAITALQVGVPIVPAALHGLFEIWPRGKGLQWHTLLPWAGTRCDVRFGPPISPDGVALAAGSDRYEQHTAALRAAVVQMWDALESQRRQR